MKKAINYIILGLASAYLALSPQDSYATSTPLHKRITIEKKFNYGIGELPTGEPIIIPALPQKRDSLLPLELRLPELEELPGENDQKREYKPNFLPTPQKMQEHENNKGIKRLQRLPPVD